jgi:predicted N-acyltransferase
MANRDERLKNNLRVQWLAKCKQFILHMNNPQKEMLMQEVSIRRFNDPREIPRQAWNELWKNQANATPFMRHEYLCALHASNSAVPSTGWNPKFITLWQGDKLRAACPLYVKSHSYGEYVFDWAWANAYELHGLPYYPKAVITVPFTPVPGVRLMASDAQSKHVLLDEVVKFAKNQEFSSLHLLWLNEEDQHVCESYGLITRNTVQFHWRNAKPGYTDFDSFLASLTHEKRKKIRQERRKVAQAGVSFRTILGEDMSTQDWDFFYRCYAQTYFEHRNAPYLSRDFFDLVANEMPQNWIMFLAERNGHAIACSLVAVSERSENGIAYGRYWGALERVDCLHFEACYYQPLQWCIEQRLQRFEGGAQGEHKLARALLPVRGQSAHWLENPDFAQAVERFVDREGLSIDDYLDDLESRSPMKSLTTNEEQKISLVEEKYSSS